MCLCQLRTDYMMLWARVIIGACVCGVITRLLHYSIVPQNWGLQPRAIRTDSRRHETTRAIGRQKAPTHAKRAPQREKATREIDTTVCARLTNVRSGSTALQPHKYLPRSRTIRYSCFATAPPTLRPVEQQGIAPSFGAGAGLFAERKRVRESSFCREHSLEGKTSHRE